MSITHKLQAKYKVTASDRMETFLAAATDQVAKTWKAASGRSMSAESLSELLSTLDSFFQGVKYDWFRKSDED